MYSKEVHSEMEETLEQAVVEAMALGRAE